MAETGDDSFSKNLKGAGNLERLLDLQPLHIAELDAELVVVYQNRNELQFALGEKIIDQLPAEMRENCLALFNEVLGDGESRQFNYPTSKERYLETLVSRLDDGEGHRLCLLTKDVTDITTQRARSEEDRRKLAVALDATKIGLWSWNVENETVIWDERMREMTGHDIPLNLPEWRERLMHPEDREKSADLSGLFAQGGRFPPQSSRIIRPDGQIRWLMTTGMVCLGNHGQPELIVGGCIDVTEHQRLNEKLQAAQRMEALGHLTAGVAHNFNNMLMVITPCLEAIAEVAVAEIKEDVSDALAATERAAEVVRQLMAFAGQRNKTQRTTQSVAPLVREVVRLCGRSFEENIYFSMKIESKLCLNAAPGAIQQVLSNVIFNARDALISAEIESPCIEVTCRDANVFEEQWVEIVIADNGPGVPDDMRTKIFEPFVTTKMARELVSGWHLPRQLLNSTAVKWLVVYGATVGANF